MVGLSNRRLYQSESAWYNELKLYEAWHEYFGA